MKFFEETFDLLYTTFCIPVKNVVKVFADPLTLSISFSLGVAYDWLHHRWELDHIISWNLFTGVVVLLMIDTVLGMWKHWHLKTFSSSGFGKLLGKVVIYWAFFKMADIVARVQLLGWTGDFMVSALLIREAISITENMAILRPELIPSWILKRLKDFDEDGKVDNK